MSAQKYFATIGTTGHSRFSDISNLFLKYHQESRSMGNICKGKQLFYALATHYCTNSDKILTFMPCPFTGPKMFCAGPNFLSQPKNLTAFSASSKTFVPAKKPILLNVNKCLVQHKKWGPTQNILEPVKGQGISMYNFKQEQKYSRLPILLT